MSPDLVSLVNGLTAITTGATAAGAIAHILCDEDDDIALERCKESSALPSCTSPATMGGFEVAK
jgi:hypothetical protein